MTEIGRPAGRTEPATRTERTFQSLAKQSVALQTVEAIKEMIRRGELIPHQALPPERELARALEISRPTLREAIGALTAMNILESHHGDGTFVTSLSPQLLAAPISFLLQVDEAAAGDLADISRALQVEAARIAATRITAADLVRVDELGQEAAAAAAAGDPARIARAEAAFREAVIAAAGNPLLRNLYSAIDGLSAGTRPADALGRIPADHAVIVRALRRRAPGAAAEAMLAHLAGRDGAAGFTPEGTS